MPTRFVREFDDLGDGGGVSPSKGPVACCSTSSKASKRFIKLLYCRRNRPSVFQPVETKKNDSVAVGRHDSSPKALALQLHRQRRSVRDGAGRFSER